MSLENGVVWYIAGPMTGLPQFNYPLFDKIAANLRAQGVKVITPSELDTPNVREEALTSPDGDFSKFVGNGDTWGDILSRDVKIVANEVSGILLLPGWHQSRGARLEVFVGLLTGKQFAIFQPERSYDYEKDEVRTTGTYMPTTADRVRNILMRFMP